MKAFVSEVVICISQSMHVTEDAAFIDPLLNHFNGIT